MTLDGLLTFLGLMVAAYAALPPLGKLRLRLELPGQACLGIIALVLALGLQF